MTGSPADVKLVSNAMANATRRKIMSMLVEKDRTKDEIAQSEVASMLDYHLHMLQQAGLADSKEGLIALTDFGKILCKPGWKRPQMLKKTLQE